jgi:hypothetical protein
MRSRPKESIIDYAYEKFNYLEKQYNQEYGILKDCEKGYRTSMISSHGHIFATRYKNWFNEEESDFCLEWADHDDSTLGS